MDLARFLALLSTSQLYFSRIDALEDWFEGSLTNAHYKMTLMDEVSTKLWRGLRKRVYVNCWFSHEAQSIAMWSIYGKSKSSVAIRTTLKKLIAVLLDSGATGYPLVGLVDYLDFQKDGPRDMRNIMTPSMQKDKVYAYEHELRVLVAVGQEELLGKGRGEWSKVGETGLTCPINNLSDLIEAVFVHPEVEQWFKLLVVDLLNKYHPELTQRFVVTSLQPLF